MLSIRRQEKLTDSEAATRFGIGQASIVRWSKSLGSQRTRNKSTVKLDWEALTQDVQDSPDSYQAERAARFGVSQPCITYTLKQLKIARKKTFKHPKANPEAQQIFQTQRANYHQMNQPMVYIDERGFAHQMPRRYGYLPRGMRCGEE